MSDPQVIEPVAPAATDSTISVGPGENYASFDELESVHAAAKKQERDTKKSETEKISKIVDKKLEKEIKPKAKDGAKQADESDENEEIGLDTENVAAKKVEAKPKKILKAKVGDKEVDLDADAILSHKIGGKEEQVSVQDLLNNYSGKVAWDRKFNELTVERRTFKAEKQKLQDNVDTVMKTWTESKDPEGAFYVMAEKFGYDPLKLRKDLYDSLIPSLEKYYEMSEDQRKQADLEFENKTLKKRTESAETLRANELSQREVASKVQSLQEAHQIPQTEFLDRFDELEDLRKQGKLTENITPEFVAETIIKDKLWTSMEPVLKEVAPDLQGDAQAKLLMDLCNEGFSKKLSAKDMVDIVRELYPSNRKSKALSEKLRDAEEERGERTPQKKKADLQSSSEPLFFDDL